MPDSSDNALPVAFFAGPKGDEFRALVAVAKDALASRFKVLPWYDVDKAGSVTELIVEQIIDSSCVLADLRGDNANVYYEVGLAHAFGRPVIPFITEGASAAFDVKDQIYLAVRVGDDGIANAEDIERRLRRVVDSLRTSPARTAIDAVRRRREQAERQADNARGGTAYPAASSARLLSDGWSQLAHEGRLAPLGNGPILPGTPVYHTLHGGGIIVGTGPSSSPDQNVVIRFDEGQSILPTATPGLFLLRIVPT